MKYAVFISNKRDVFIILLISMSIITDNDINSSSSVENMFGKLIFWIFSGFVEQRDGNGFCRRRNFEAT